MEGPFIAISGAAEPPLRQVDLELPLGKLICFVGQSGAGGRTLAVDVLYAESRRRYLQVLSAFEREALGGGGQVAVEQVRGLPPAIHLDGRLRRRESLAAFLQVEGALGSLWQERGQYRCPACGGDCRAFAPEEAAVEAAAIFAGETCLVLAPLRFTPAVLEEVRRAGFLRLRAAGELIRLDSAAPGEGEGEVVVDRVAAAPQHHGRLVEACRQARSIARGRSLFAGVGKQVWLNQQLSCRQCGAMYPELNLGQRPLGASPGIRVVFGGWQVEELARRRVEEVLELLEQGDEGAGAARRPLAEAHSLGLGGLGLAQRVDQLSTGQQQRLQLASCLSLGLAGVLYVFETPTLGLHPRQVGSQVQGLRRLAAQGNTVVALDHTPELIRAADQLVEFVDGAARKVASWQGAAMAPPARRRVASRFLQVRTGAVDLHIPLGCLVGVCGESGAGKTALLRQVIAPGLRARRDSRVRVEGKPGLSRVVEVDGRELGGGKSLLAHLGLFEKVAALYAETPAARQRGHGPQWFLLDRPGGRCPTCEGAGALRCELEFFDDISSTCPACEGRRFRPEALELTWHGLNIGEVLALTLDQAARRFGREPGLGAVLETACQCGLGRRSLGEAGARLERAERLRLQLALERGRSGSRDLFIVEQPAGGAHPEDLRLLLQLLGELADRGASVLVEDHHPALLGAADWLVEIAPDGNAAVRGPGSPQSA